MSWECYDSNCCPPERIKALSCSLNGPHRIEFWAFRPHTIRLVSSRCTRYFAVQMVLMFTKPKLRDHFPGNAQNRIRPAEATPRQHSELTARSCGYILSTWAPPSPWRHTRQPSYRGEGWVFRTVSAPG